VFGGWAFGRRRSPRSAAGEPALRIAALLIAHDEEQVIEGAVASLREQDYPRGQFEVVVVADNCSDRTAERAGAAGAAVLERQSGGARASRRRRFSDDGRLPAALDAVASSRRHRGPGVCASFRGGWLWASGSSGVRRRQEPGRAGSQL
jgi:glycosyltransferase involved in cell wall biosynthesis